jgi:methylglutaconyl-CoA hydratase
MNDAISSFSMIEVTRRGAVATIVLNRPDVHNAFDETLIAELTRAVAVIAADETVRVAILEGRGKSFCAGADLNWMKRMATFSEADNLADANALADMLAALNGLAKPTIARVHGAAFGGGVGLIACCDIAVGVTGATFSLSEARLGLIPATISPYVIEAIGARSARRMFLTAERFSADEAKRLGLLHEVVAPGELDSSIDQLVDALLSAGPHAQAESKALIGAVAHRPIDAQVMSDTARRIARVRGSAEGKEGVAAFLAKRSAGWVPKG